VIAALKALRHPKSGFPVGMTRSFEDGTR